MVQWATQQRGDDGWCFVERGLGYYAVYNRISGKVLSVPGKSIASWIQNDTNGLL